MLYEKPDIKYTEMCMFIDAHAYDEEMDDVTQSTIFEYLYHIYLMFAGKHKYFSREKYYDDFAVYCATRTFMRLRNKKQFELDASGNPKLKKIKSILNYIKKTIDMRRVDFEQEFYSQIYSNGQEDTTYCCEYSFADMLSDSIDSLSMVEFDCCLGDIVKTSKAFLSQIPYKNDPVMWTNIYISCMLTFLNAVTLTQKDINRIRNFKKGLASKDGYMDALYMKEARNSTILYHLDDNMYDYITVLTREMKHAIAKDLSLEFDTYIPGNSGMRVLIDQELQGGISEQL